MINLTGVISRLGTGSYTVTRTAARTDTLGRLNAPSTSTLTIDAVVLAVPSKDWSYLPEGATPSASRYVWTATALRIEPEPDTVTIDGAIYVVTSLWPRTDHGSFYKALVVLQ